MSCSRSAHPRAFLAASRALHDLDDSQAQSVFHAALRKCRPAANAPTAAQWQALVDRQITELALDKDMPEAKFDRLCRYLQRVRDHEPPDARTFAALSDMQMRARKAAAAVRRQLDSAAALRGVTPYQAAERYRAYREQYLADYARLPADERPDPPADWADGYRTKDMMAVSSPQDRATLYAMYRVQADPDAFGPARDQRFASTDLETAGPAGRDGFDPANGSIIEVGIVEYDGNGNETARWGQLVRPAESVAAACGTGAEHIHGITMADVADAPDWDAVAPQVADRLAGRTLLAQNARYEQDWLTHHMAAARQPYDRWAPTVDTMTIAKQHMSGLPNHRLSTICQAVGVDYTDGHRAVHDSEVAAKAFFAMRARMQAQWSASPARAAAPQPPEGAGRRSRVQRVSAGDYDPATVPDAWAVPAQRKQGANA